MDYPLAPLALITLLSTVVDTLGSLLDLLLTPYRGYSWLIREAVDAVRSLFEDYGYWVVFFGTLLENTLLLGLFVPGALVILLAGLAAHDGSISPPIAIALGVLGTIIGDTISYCLGRFGYSRFGNGRAVQEFEQKVREPILRRGALFVLVYHFAGYTRLVGPAAAGFLKMPYHRWAPADYTGALLWVGAYFAIGYALGLAGISLDDTDKWIRYFEVGLLVFVCLWGYYLYTVTLRNWHARQTPDDATPPEPEPVAVQPVATD